MTQSFPARGKICSHSPSWCIEEAAVGVCQVATWFITNCLDSYRKVSVFKYQGVLSDVRVFFSWLHNSCYHPCCWNTIWEHFQVNECCGRVSLKMYYLTRGMFSEGILHLVLNQQFVHTERKRKNCFILSPVQEKFQYPNIYIVKIRLGAHLNTKCQTWRAQCRQFIQYVLSRKCQWVNKTCCN